MTSLRSRAATEPTTSETTGRRVARRRLVGHLSLQPAVNVTVEESLWDAWQLMFVSGLRSLVVMDGETCSGLINDRQILTDVPINPDVLRRLKVGEVATLQSRPITERSSIAHAAKIMDDMRSEAVVVTDDAHHVIGVVTSRDIVAWAASNLER